MKKGIKLIIVSLLFLPALTGCSKEKMKLASKEVSVEYGKTISTEAKTYLKNDEDFLKDVTVKGIPDNELEKEYPAVGEYEIVLKNTNEEQKLKVSVKDTTAPEFKDIKDKYEVEFGSKLDTKNIKAEDLSEVTVTLDDKNVNYKQNGDYKATVIAKDTSGNETKKEISIVVKEEEKKETTVSDKKSDSSNSKSNTAAANTSKKSNNSSSSNKSTDQKTSGSSNSSSNSNKTNQNKGNSSSVTVTPDSDTYYEFDGGYSIGGGGNLELPSEWGY